MELALGNYFRVKIPDLEDIAGTSRQTSPPSVQNKYQCEKKLSITYWPQTSLVPPIVPLCLG